MDLTLDCQDSPTICVHHSAVLVRRGQGHTASPSAMHIPVERFSEAYERIKECAVEGHGAETVLIFVGPDVDAICACKLLVGLLKTDWIAHKLVPVASYSDLTEVGRELVLNNDDARSIVLINCGGIVNLAQIFEELLPHQQIYVYESRRPLNLDNLFGNESVHVFDDGHVENELKDERNAFESTEFAASDDDDDDDEDEYESEDLHEQEEDVENKPDDENMDPPESDEMGDQPKTAAKSRRRKRTAMRERQRKRRKHENLLFDYYTQGSWHGAPASVSVFQLANQLGRATLDFTWYAIVGLTYQYQCECISEQRYLEALRDLDAVVTRLTVSGERSQVSNQGAQIARETDFCLALYRHWNLFEAMLHSRRIACRLSTWTDKGLSRLRFLLTKMGVPMDEYNKPFTHVDKAVKDVLFDDLLHNAPLVGLDKLQWMGFTRRTWLGQSLSSADAVASLCALSIWPHASAMAPAIGGAGIGDFSVPSSVSADLLDPLPRDAPETSDDPSVKRSEAFYAVLDALSEDPLLYSGISTAKAITKAIFTLVGSIISRRAIKTLRGFRYVILRDFMGADPALIANPTALRDLAIILFGALREINRGDLPLVVAALQPPANDTFLLLGFAGAATDGLVRRNPMGIAFQAAATETQARHRHDAFDANLIEVARDDITEFLEQLQVSLAAGR